MHKKEKVDEGVVEGNDGVVEGADGGHAMNKWTNTYITVEQAVELNTADGVQVPADSGFKLIQSN